MAEDSPGAGATIVLFDAPDRVNPRKLVKGADNRDGVLTTDQIGALRDYGEVLGIKILWSGGITALQAFDLARRRVFGIFSTSSTAAKMAVTAQFEQDPRLAAENEPTEFGVRRMHAIIQGGFLSSRIRGLDADLASELELTARVVVSGGEVGNSQAALTELNELLVCGWRQLHDDRAPSAADRIRHAYTASRPVPADAVRVFRGRKKEGTSRQEFVQRLEHVFIPMTVQMQRLYGLTAYLPAVLPVSEGSTVPDEVALVFYRTQGCYYEAKRCIGGRAYSELHELAFDMSASRSGFPQLLAGNVIVPDQPYYLFERCVDWQTGGSRLFVGSCRTDAGAEAFLAGVAKVAQHVQANPMSLDAVVFSATGDRVVWWDHAPEQLANPVPYFRDVTEIAYASAPLSTSRAVKPDRAVLGPLAKSSS